MIRYESDSKAIARALNSLGEGEAIDHGTAHAIATGYNDYRTAHFVSTGYMPQGDAQWLMDAVRNGVDAQTLKDDSEALTALMVYLLDREESGDTGRVDGWAGMWVPKHVDYPHENGALDTCWCFEDDENECEGHESQDGAHMGESVFCDGSCVED